MGRLLGDTVLDYGARMIEWRADKISASMVFRRFDGDRCSNHQKLFCISIRRYSCYSKVFFVFVASHVVQVSESSQKILRKDWNRSIDRSIAWLMPMGASIDRSLDRTDDCPDGADADVSKTQLRTISNFFLWAKLRVHQMVTK